MPTRPTPLAVETAPGGCAAKSACADSPPAWARRWSREQRARRVGVGGVGVGRLGGRRPLAATFSRQARRASRHVLMQWGNSINRQRLDYNSPLNTCQSRNRFSAIITSVTTAPSAVVSR
jgi:hypothetical protein